MVRQKPTCQLFAGATFLSIIIPWHSCALQDQHDFNGIRVRVCSLKLSDDILSDVHVQFLNGPLGNHSFLDGSLGKNDSPVRESPKSTKTNFGTEGAVSLSSYVIYLTTPCDPLHRPKFKKIFVKNIKAPTHKYNFEANPPKSLSLKLDALPSFVASINAIGLPIFCIISLL